MKISNRCKPFFALLTVVLAAGTVRAADQPAAVAEKSFVSPEQAIQALLEATKIHDEAKLNEIFGPEVHDLLTGDKTQDRANSQRLAQAMAMNCKPVPEGSDKIILEIGPHEWPFPIPLVKTNSQWHFDTAAGKEEIINRHIGKDELHAIGVCRAYVQAQLQYAALNRDANGAGQYALKFKSTPGKKDGLYWKAGENEAASPFGPLVAEAHVEGYQTKGKGPLAFHGYFFRILTRQGPAAPGGPIDYMKDGKLTGGFALVAYPENWGKSGIMTFIVNQQGKVFQHNFGEKTSEVAAAMTEYSLEGGWSLVTDQGVFEK